MKRHIAWCFGYFGKGNCFLGGRRWMPVVFEFRNVEYILKFNSCLRLLALLYSDNATDAFLDMQ